MRRCLTASLVALLALLLSVAMAPRAIADDPDPVSGGSAYIGSCLQSARSVSALFMLDRSGSLAGTDPSGIRYEGLQTALQQLSQLTRTDGETLSVEVAIAAFDDQYDEARSIVDWTAINDDPANADRDISRIIKQTRDRTGPRGGTDFELPLRGGLSEFNDRQGAGNCRLLFWFTDGQFEHNPIGVEAARASMCAPGGLVDELRQAGIVIIGLQLGTNSLDLKPMVLGSADGTTCGTQPIPEGWAPGIYLEADDSASLKRIFGRINDIVQGCTPAGSSGNIDPGVHRMRVTINTPQLSQVVRFDAPSGENFTAGTDGETTTQSGYVVRSIRDDHYVSMDVTLPMTAPAGQWRITPDLAVPPEDITFCVFSDLRLERPGGLPTQGGLTPVVSVRVVDRDGQSASLADYQSVTPAVSVLAHGGTPRTANVTVDPQGSIDIVLETEPTDAVVDISLRLHLVTSSGLALTPLAIDFRQALVLPSEFPNVQPADVLDLGRAVKTKPATADLQLMGSPDGPTQVCLDAPIGVFVPDDAAGTNIEYPTGCVELDTSEAKTISVSVTPTHAAVGDGEGTIPVRLVSAPSQDGNTQSTEFGVLVVWRFTNPTFWFVTVLVAAVVGLLSALVPLLATGVAGWWAARYDMRGLRGAVIDVVVTRDAVRRTEPIEGQPGRLVDVLALAPIPGGGVKPRRSFEFGGVRFRSKASLSPARAPLFWAEASPGQALLASSGRPGDPEDGRTVTTTPGLGFVTILSCAVLDLQGSQPEIPGQLILLTKTLETNASRLDTIALSPLDVGEFRRRLRDLATPSSVPDADSTSNSTTPPDLWD